jgi:hypothetical protein
MVFWACIAKFRTVTEDGLVTLDDSIVAMVGWLDHIPGLSRPAYPEELDPSISGNQYHVSDGCHRKSYLANMYVIFMLVFFMLHLFVF